MNDHIQSISNFVFESNVDISSKFLQFLYSKFNLDFYKYKSLPTIYALLYDKYNRNDLFEDIIKNKEEKNDKIFKKRLRNFKEKTCLEKNMKFEEILIINFYDLSFNNKILGYSLFFLIPITLFLNIKINKNKESRFFLLNNTRYIQNTIGSIKRLFISLINIELILLSALSFGTFCKGIIAQKFISLEEEEEFIKNNQDLLDKYNEIRQKFL
jgi:hypothetical protein